MIFALRVRAVLRALGVSSIALAFLATGAAAEESRSATKAYFGAVHVHTGYSFDAFTNGTQTLPHHAYEWARGKAIPGGGGGPDIKLDRPLDFYAVSDHAEFMGVFRLMADPSNPLSKTDLAKRVTSKEPGVALQAFAEVLRDKSEGRTRPELVDPAVTRPIWKTIVETADRYYEPGAFTTFPAFEWTANPHKRNLHRVVVFASSKGVPELPLSSDDSEDPEDLWRWMDAARANGATLLAIPHNANASDGLMFALETFEKKPLSKAYSEKRAANEPLYEVSQIKGTSETHPELSPNDELAGFEQWDYTLSADAERPSHRAGSFARKAYLDGLSLARSGLGNPFRFGLIGDSDTHNAAASQEEDHYTGKFGMENDPRMRIQGEAHGMTAGQAQQIREFSSAGLAGVWAEENTREAIFAAMSRKETFGTSGPRIQVRFFGGWSFEAADAKSGDFAATGHRKGVAMGGTLAARGAAKAPSFLLAAAKDPRSGHLDRVQVIKGWLDAAGAQHERIYDVAWSGERKPDAAGKLPPIGNTVDPKTATYTNSIGAAELAAAWTDPDFDPAAPAFYYLRAIEIPTPRWSTRDAVALGVPIPAGLPATIQERAWSSPIWYEP